MKLFKRFIFKILGLKKCNRCGRPMKVGKKGCVLCIRKHMEDTYGYAKCVCDKVNKHFGTYEDLL